MKDFDIYHFENDKFSIEQFLSLDGYDTEVRKSRRKNSEVNSQEFFTPYSIVKKMADKIAEEDWANPQKTFSDPAAGNGQFILFILYRRIHEYNIPWQTALETTYSVELMEDNVQEQCQRVHELLRNISPDYDPEIANKIMDKNFVCHDFFTWNFEEWRPYTEEELKPKKKIKKNPNQLEIDFK